MHYPYEWAPYIVEITIMKIGNLVILAVPGEFTTMAGRRLIKAVREKVEDSWGEDIHFVIAGLSNTYSSYITTYEEYQVQRYEGGFTLFGPHTLDAYIQEFSRLADCMVGPSICTAGPLPPNLLNKQWSLVPGVLVDAVPFGHDFGDVSIDLQGQTYHPGDVAEAEFHAACPRNNVRLEGSFIQIQRKKEKSWNLHRLWRHMFQIIRGLPSSPGGTREEEEGSWAVEFTDSDWSTKFFWYRKDTLSPYSYAKIHWEIPERVKKGTYRIKYLGDYKDFLGEIKPFEGVSTEFQVI